MQRKEAAIFTAIREVSQSGTFNHVIELVKNGADLCATNSNHLTPMQLARELRLWSLITTIAQIHKANADDNERYGHAMLSAIRHNEEATAMTLFNAGASLTWMTDNDLNRAVHWAIKNRLLKILALIIENDDALTCKNKDGHTPLQLAMNLGYWDCAAMIADKYTSHQLDLTEYNGALYASIQAQLHFPSSLSQDSHTLAELSKMHFNQLTINAVMAKDIPATIETINENDLHLLIILNQELDAKRVTLKDTHQSLSTQARLITNLQNSNIDVLTRTINAFLNFPNPSIPQQDHACITHMRDMKISAAEIIVDYMVRKEKIDAYVHQLGKWLIKLKQHLSTTPWLVKNLCGNWVYGEPNHVKIMLAEVDAITMSSKQVDILNAYKKIMHILLTMPESGTRHDDTKGCYQLFSSEIQNIKFNIESSEQQTAPTLHTTCNDPFPAAARHLFKIAYTQPQDIDKRQNQSTQQQASLSINKSL